MKKFIIFTLFCALVPVFAACEVSNTELANSLEGNLTRLVYSVGYLDSVSTEELSGLVNNSSYFTHSSLYSGTTTANESASNEMAAANPTAEVSENTLSTESKIANNNDGIALSGGLGETAEITSGRTAFQEAAYRSNLYTTSIGTTPLTTGGYASGTVDMSLLESNAEDLNDILLSISAKRGIIMLYCTDLRSGRATLSAENKAAISEYNDIIKETTNFLNNNTGNLSSYFNGISSISANENSAELINAKLIRANELLKTRYAKLDTCLDSLNAIINILVTSIGYDYANLYNQSIEQNKIESVNIESNTTDGIGITNTAVGDGTNNDNMIVDPNPTMTETPTTYPSLNKNCTIPGDTNIIVNYENGYSTQKSITSSDCNNCTNQPETLICPDNNCCENNNPAEKTTNNNNILNYIKPNGFSKTKNADGATEIGLGTPMKKSTAENKTPTPEISLELPELTESEKELTPDLLPFAGEKTEPKTLELKPVNPEAELGLAAFLPFVYEESDVTRKVPR